ncbi:lipocalin family protein [Candidatus Neomarinimicrobiota bacterium]
MLSSFLIHGLIAIILTSPVIAKNDMKELKPVEHVDIDKFMGKWYVVGVIPTFAEKDAVNAIETYELNKKGNIDITFTHYKKSPDGKFKEYHPKGFIFNKKTNSEWRVQFFWPFKFKYLVIDLADDYRYTVIGVPNKKFLWIMARDTQLSTEDNKVIREKLVQQGYDITKIVDVPQIWN